ncbi:MAG: permease, partial [Rhodospirillales bacterium]|nr:permease [Rhodospirillales bacterium]
MSDAAPDIAEGPGKGMAAFRYADFRNYFLARSLARFAFEMQAAAVLWQVWHLTGSTLDLGLIGLVQFLPFMVLFPLAGLAADRFRRARVIAVCISVQVVCSLGLMALTFSGHITFPIIMIILAIAGFLRSFQLPAEQAIIPLLVDRNDFANASAWTTTGNHLARVGGPAVAGLMLILGEQVVYATVVVVMLVAVVFALIIKANTQVVSRERITFASVFAGMKFIFQRQLILGMITLDLFAVLLASATALLPVFATDILMVGPVGYGFLRASITIGSFSGSLLFTQFPVYRRAGHQLLASMAIYGAATIVFALSREYWLSCTALALLGFTDSVSIFIRNNVIGLVTPDEMRGRV